MKKILCAIFFVCFILIRPISTQAVTIVDTGEPDNTGRVNSWYGLASEFTLDGAYTLNEIEGYFELVGSESDLTKVVDLIIYSVGADGLPDTELFSNMFSTQSTQSKRYPNWYGLDGLNWNLLQGTYWVSFEVENLTPNLHMPTSSDNPPINMALINGNSYPDYFSVNVINIGVRIQGTLIPEPTTMLLFGSGLLGLAGFRRKFKKA